MTARAITRACLACAALSTAIGCRESPPRNAPADSRVGAVAVVQSTGPAPLPSCPGTGHWEPCTIFDRLERAGLAPQRGDTIAKPFLHVAGVTWRIGAASIHIFRYRDSVARHTDSAALDSLHARPRGDTVSMWAGTPTLLVNDNILAVLLSDNAEQVERVSLALTAGPPPKAGAAAPK